MDNKQDNAQQQIQSSQADNQLHSLLAPPQRQQKPVNQIQRNPNIVKSQQSSMGQNVVLTQNGLIKEVQKFVHFQGDEDRMSSREQLVESLLREASMSKEKMQDIDKHIKNIYLLQQQNSKNDECSSGGTMPQFNAISDQNFSQIQGNAIALIIQLSIWTEDTIFDKFKDSKSPNYKTLVRRLAQALKSKEELKSTILTCCDKDSVVNFVQEFNNQRNPLQNNSNQKEQISEQFLQNQETNQEQSQATQNSNPFGGVGKSSLPSRGGPQLRGAPRGRGGPRFAAPAMGRFAVPSSLQQPEPNLSNQSNFLQEGSQKQFIESGSADQSSSLFNQQINFQQQNQTDQNELDIIGSNNQNSQTIAQQHIEEQKFSEIKQINNDQNFFKEEFKIEEGGDSGSAFNIDFIDQLNIQESLKNNSQAKEEFDFLEEYLKPQQKNMQQNDQQASYPESFQQQQSNILSQSTQKQKPEQKNQFQQNQSQRNFAQTSKQRQHSTNVKGQIHPRIQVDPSQQLKQEEISSVGLINSFNNECEERPDLDYTSQLDSQNKNTNNNKIDSTKISKKLEPLNSQNSLQVPSQQFVQSNHQSLQIFSDEINAQNLDNIVASGSSGQVDQIKYEQDYSKNVKLTQNQSGHPLINNQQDEYFESEQINVQIEESKTFETDQQNAQNQILKNVQYSTDLSSQFISGETGSKNQMFQESTNHDQQNQFVPNSLENNQRQFQNPLMTPPSAKKKQSIFVGEGISEYQGKNANEILSKEDVQLEKYLNQHITSERQNQTGRILQQAIQIDTMTTNELAKQEISVNLEEDTSQSVNHTQDYIIESLHVQSEQTKKKSQKLLPINQTPSTKMQNKMKQSQQLSSNTSKKSAVQVQNFMNFRPPESLASASMASIPITTFEDTQQMLRAYKKKKREILKLKEQYSKLEMDYLSIKQKNSLIEEELSHTQKRLQRVEKQLKQNLIKDQINDESIYQKQLALKGQEQEALINDLKQVKSENQKLKEKLKDVLVKYSNQNQNAIKYTQENDFSLSGQDLKILQQQHNNELAQTREQKNIEIRQLNEEIIFYKENNEKAQRELQIQAQFHEQQSKNLEIQLKKEFNKQIEQIENVNQQEKQNLIDQINQLKYQVNNYSQQNSNLSQQENENQNRIMNELKQTMEKKVQDLIKNLSNEQSNVQALKIENKELQLQIDQRNIEVKILQDENEILKQQNSDYLFNQQNSNFHTEVQEEQKQSQSQNLLLDPSQNRSKQSSSQEQEVSYNSWQVIENQSQQELNLNQQRQNENLLIQSDYFQQQNDKEDTVINEQQTSNVIYEEQSSLLRRDEQLNEYEDSYQVYTFYDQNQTQTNQDSLAFTQYQEEEYTVNKIESTQNVNVIHNQESKEVSEDNNQQKGNKSIVDPYGFFIEEEETPFNNIAQNQVIPNSLFD